MIAKTMNPNFLKTLQQFLMPHQIRQGESIDASYQKDWSSCDPALPLAVLLPENTQQVADIMKACAEYKQSIVPQGGRTGLAGAACPSQEDVCLSLERIKGIEEIDVQANTMTVLAGTCLQTVQESALEFERYFPMDFGARGSCQIGGAIATNAGGNNVIRFGMMRDLVLGLEVVTAKGEVLNLQNKMMKNNVGYDLKQLFIGSEGTLGIITKATLKVISPPGDARTALCALDSYEKGVALLRFMQKELNQNVHAYEMMWQDFYTMSCSWSCPDSPPIETKYPIYALIESKGCDEEGFNQSLGKAFEADLICDAVVASSLRERDKIWTIREATSEFSVKLSPISFDISLPIGSINQFVDECRSLLSARWPNLLIVNFGHIGDSNLHLTVDASSDIGVVESAVDEIVYACVEQFSGSISAEHGIGILKRDYLHHSVTPLALEMMATVKKSLDPLNILNPGKVILI
ncbi:MAG: FAD-binding oxidoreductase [Marinomonas sp.]